MNLTEVVLYDIEDKKRDDFAKNDGRSNYSGFSTSPFVKQIITCSSVIFNGISMGMTFSFTSTFLPQIPHLSTNAGSWLAGSITLAIPIGILLSSLIMRKYGRKMANVIASILGLIGWASLFIWESFYFILVSCLFLGVSHGFVTILLNVYISEISEPRYRGLISIIASAIIGGSIVFSHILGIVCHFKVAFTISTLIPITSLICVFFMDETPNWLILAERFEEAKKIFFKLRHHTSENQRELDELLNKTPENLIKKKKGIFRNMATKKFLKPFFILTFLFTALIGSGYDITLFYAIDMLEKMTSKKKAPLFLILLDVVRLLANFLSCFLINILSRRFLFFISGVATLLSLILMISSVIFNLSQYVTFVYICLYTLSIYVGMNPIPRLMTTELYPEVIRDIASGMTLIWAYIIAKITPIILGFTIRLGGIEYSLTVLASTLLICLIVLYFVMPETKNKSLQQIENDAGN